MPITFRVDLTSMFRWSPAGLADVGTTGGASDFERWVALPFLPAVVAASRHRNSSIDT